MSQSITLDNSELDKQLSDPAAYNPLYAFVCNRAYDVANDISMTKEDAIKLVQIAWAGLKACQLEAETARYQAEIVRGLKEADNAFRAAEGKQVRLEVPNDDNLQQLREVAPFGDIVIPDWLRDFPDDTTI